MLLSVFQTTEMKFCQRSFSCAVRTVINTLPTSNGVCVLCVCAVCVCVCVCACACVRACMRVDVLGVWMKVCVFSRYITVLVEMTRFEGTRQGHLIAGQMLDVTVRVRDVRPFAVKQMVHVLFVRVS